MIRPHATSGLHVLHAKLTSISMNKKVFKPTGKAIKERHHEKCSKGGKCEGEENFGSEIGSMLVLG